MPISFRTLAGLTALACFALVSVGLHAYAGPEDLDARAAARERFAEHRAGFPEPSDESAFRFEGALVLNGERQGTCMFEMVVRRKEDKVVGWTAEDDLRFQASETPDLRLQATARLAADLEPIEGAGTPVMADVVRSHQWTRTPKGFEVGITTMSSEEGAHVQSATAKHEGPALTTWAAIIFFARSILDTVGVYETTLWDPLENEKANALATLSLESKGRSKFAGKDVLLVVGTRARQSLRFAFDPETRAFLGATVYPGHGMEIGFLPPGSGRDPVPGEVAEKTGIGDHQLAQGEMERAVTSFTEALEGAVDHVPALLGRARARYYLEAYPKALEDLARVMELEPENPAPYELRALIRERTEDAKGAVEDYARVLELDPDGPHAARMIARRGHARLAAGDLEGAEKDLDLAIERDPTDSTLWRGRGILRENAGRTAEAIEDFEKACELDPSSPQDWFNLGLTLMRAEKWKRAVEVFTTALDRSGPHPIPLVRRAVAKLETGSEAGWLGDLFEAARLAPSEPVEVWPTSLRTDLAYAAAIAAEGSASVAVPMLQAVRANESADPDMVARTLLWEWVAHLGAAGVNPASVRIEEFLEGATATEEAAWSFDLLRVVEGSMKPAALRKLAEAIKDAEVRSARLAEALFLEGALSAQRGETVKARETLAASLGTNAEATPAWFAAGILLGRLDGTEDAQLPKTD